MLMLMLIFAIATCCHYCHCFSPLLLLPFSFIATPLRAIFAYYIISLIRHADAYFATLFRCCCFFFFFDSCCFRHAAAFFFFFLMFSICDVVLNGYITPDVYASSPTVTHTVACCRRIHATSHAASRCSPHAVVECYYRHTSFAICHVAAMLLSPHTLLTCHMRHAAPCCFSCCLALMLHYA